MFDLVKGVPISCARHISARVWNWSVSAHEPARRVAGVFLNVKHKAFNKLMRRAMLHIFMNISNRFSLLFGRRADNPGNTRSAGVIDDDIDEAVVYAFSHGSEPAFRQIYDRYAPAIYRVVQRYFQSSALAEELVEELFSTLWRERGMYAHAAQLRQSLFACAKDLAIDYLDKVTVEIISASHAQPSAGSETIPAAKTAVSPVNMLQHSLENVRQPQA